MSETRFQAMVVREAADGTFERRIEERSIDDLPAGDVLIRVEYSSLNYKDALSATGNRGVTRNYPHTPGIDAAGTVAASTSASFAPGDPVVTIGHDLGMNTAGGFGAYVRVPANWVVRRPDALSARAAMALGTAGFTAAMSVDVLLGRGARPELGETLVTGATGGVGSVAVALLAKAGFRVVAATGKPEAETFLKGLGASEIVGRADVSDTSRPMLRARWIGVIDSVGGDMLASALASMRHGGTVASCGLVASPKLETTVFPFILRGVALIGIDSAECPAEARRRLWERLAREWAVPDLERHVREVALNRLEPEIERILAGKQTGRVVVAHRAAG